MKTSKVIITGAGGFLGSYIARTLIAKKEYEVYSFSRSSYPTLINYGVKERQGDLANYQDVLKALDGMDAVIHTASRVGIWGQYDDFYQTNVLGTENILKAMKKLGIKKCVYTSTPSVVFGSESLCGVDESTPYPHKYLSHYAKTKAMAEKLILEANGADLSTVALRPHLIFGPGDMNLIPRVIEAHKKGRLKIIGDGQNMVDVTYVQNAADAHLLALEKLTASHPIAGKAYFIGQGPVKLWDFTNSILINAGLPKLSKKISIRSAYFIGFIIESFLKIFKIDMVNPPMTRFIALQLGKSHYFNHHNSENDLAFYPSISIEEGLLKLLVNDDRGGRS
jgi:nucleoside-diphosphate-sugar epimerase